MNFVSRSKIACGWLWLIERITGLPFSVNVLRKPVGRPRIEGPATVKLVSPWSSIFPFSPLAWWSTRNPSTYTWSIALCNHMFSGVHTIGPVCQHPLRTHPRGGHERKAIVGKGYQVAAWNDLVTLHLWELVVNLGPVVDVKDSDHRCVLHCKQAVILGEVHSFRAACQTHLQGRLHATKVENRQGICLKSSFSKLKQSWGQCAYIGVASHHRISSGPSSS